MGRNDDTTTEVRDVADDAGTVRAGDQPVATDDVRAGRASPGEPAPGTDPAVLDGREGEEARAGDDAEAAAVPLLDDADELSGRWEAVQVAFVDEPRRAVADADALVDDTIRRLAERFSAERSRLEDQWSRGDDVSTEDLRLALQAYRSFFRRLLATA